MNTFLLAAAAALSQAKAEPQMLGECLGTVVFFEAGSAELTPVSRQRLDGLDAFLPAPFIQEPTVHLYLYAGTDRLGTTSFNLALSRRRGEAVRRYLIRRGITSDRITLTAEGENSPHDGNNSPAERRRVYVMIGAPADLWHRYVPDAIC